MDFFRSFGKTDQRAAYLQETCADDLRMRSRVEALLAAHERAGDFLNQAVCEFPLEEFLDETPISLGLTRRDDDSKLPEDRFDFLNPPNSPGELGRFAGYSITRFLGRGGAGIVLEAFDERLNRSVALKVLAPEWAAQSRARDRFLREARSAAAIRHENVVAIHAIDETATLPYLVLEYIAGPTLQDRLRQQPPLAVSEILHISRQIALGLAAAHARRLVHRDIKPANILIEEATGRIKITDFGLARAVDDVAITQEGVIAGTPQYMSPEQATGTAVDHQSDLFSLGSVMYALCAGHPPFRATTTMAVLRAICEESPVPLASLRPDIPLALVNLIEQLLAKEIADRPQSAEEVARRLDELLQNGPIENALIPASKPRGSLLERFQHKRGPLALGLIVLCVMILALVSWKLSSQNRREDFRGERAITPSSPTGPRPNQAVDASPKIRSQTLPVPQSTSRTSLPLFDESVEPFEEIRRMTVPGEQLYGLAVSPDGSRVYATATDKIIYCWNTEDGEEILRFTGLDAMTQWIETSPDGRRLVSSSGDRKLRIWDTATGKELVSYASPLPIRTATFSPDGAKLAVTFHGGPLANQVTLFDAQTCRPIEALSPPMLAEFSEARWSPDGKYLAASTEKGQVVVFDTAAKTVFKVLTASTRPGPAYRVQFSADGARVFAAGSGNMVWGWRWPEATVVFSRRFQHGVTKFAVSSDGRWLAMSGTLGVRLVSLEDPNAKDGLRELKEHASPLWDVAFVPGHDVLISCAWDGTVRLWRLPSVKPIDKN